MALTEVTLNPGVGGNQIGVDAIAGVDYEVVKQAFGDEGALTMVSPTNPLPVSISQDIEIGKAKLLDAAGTNLASISAAGALKVDGSGQTQPVSGTVAVNNFPATQPISGSVSVSNFPATQPVSGNVTANAGTNLNTSLLALEAGGNLAAILAKLIAAPATAANQATEITSLANLDVALSTRLKPADTLAAVTTVGTITNTVPTQEVAPTAVLNGKTTVATAGSRVVLASSTTCKSVTIKALITNTGLIYVGNSTVAASNGFQLSAGDSVSLDISNLNTVNLDCAVNGEGVTYAGVN